MSDREQPTHVVRLQEPVVDGQRVTFAFAVEPATDLYARTAFRLDFPASLDPGRVPAPLWWRIALICLHPHLAVLAPSRLELPVRLATGEAEVWRRLAEGYVTMLAADGMAIGPGDHVEVAETGPELPPAPAMRDGTGVASAFSGGKDSLVAAALVAEGGDPPLLVTTTSPVPWVRDHDVRERDELLAAAARELGAELVEVRSDFRATWQRDLPIERGARDIHLNEISDSMLYLAATVAVAAARGAGLALLAGECETALGRRHHGRVALCGTCYAAPFLSGVDTALATCGPRVGTLNAALHARNAQELLWSRWPALARHQLSCFHGDGEQRACGACRGCRHIALRALLTGRSPGVAGIDPAVALASALGEFAPDLSGLEPGGTPTRLLVGVLDAEAVAMLQSLTWEDVLAATREDPSLRDPEALAVAEAGWARVRARVDGLAVEPLRGYETELLHTIPAPWRDRVVATLAEALEPAPPGGYAEHAARAAELTGWITGPVRPAG